MRILALDPGGTTGYAYCKLNRDSREIPKVYGGQLAGEKHHKRLWSLLQREDWDVVVCETFQYRMVAIESGQEGTSYSPSINLISKEYIGVVELWAQTNGRGAQVVWQSPADAVGPKCFWHDTRLKKLGIHNKGEPHRNDATRHLLHYTVTKLAYRAFLDPFKPPSPT